MTFSSICISSGHGLYVRGASGILDEVDEARRVVEQVAVELARRGVKVMTFHDDISKSQNENLNRLVSWHNGQQRELDISVHFNAFESTEEPKGTEVLYVTQLDLAGEVSDAIASVGFIDRGPKQRDDLFFLNNTDMPAILIEVCFVDSLADAEIYEAEFDNICAAIADVLGGEEQLELPMDEVLFHAEGRVSRFGGPADTGVSPDEGLAFIDDVMQRPELFLPYQPEGTTGLARRLNPFVHYIACRWNYDMTPKEMLREGGMALVRSLKDPSRALTAFPADWGPASETGRVADLSPSLMLDLGLVTDNEVEIVYPWRAGKDV